MTAAALLSPGDRITADLLAGIAPLAVIKGAAQSLASSIVLADDDDLYLPVAADASYLFACYLDYEAANAVTQFSWGWTGPASYSLRYQAVFTQGLDMAVPCYRGSVSPSGDGDGAGNLMAVTMTGTLVTSAAAGTLQLQWAQTVSSTTPAIVHAQSCLALWRVS